MVHLRLPFVLALCSCLSVQSVVPTENAAAETIRALDTDGSGKVERAEVEAFAKSQGLSAAEVKAEFDSLDANGNGDLEPEELSMTLEETPAAADGDGHPVESDVSGETSNLDFVEHPNQFALNSEPVTSREDNLQHVEDDPTNEIQSPVDSPVQDAQSSDVTALEQPAEEPEKPKSLNLDIEDMEHDAQMQARRMLAQVFAQRAQEVLLQRNKDEEAAETLETLASSLRANATKLVSNAARITEHAAMVAAGSAAKQRLAEAKRLEISASKAESEAAERRKEASTAMNSALKAQDEMTTLVRQLRGK